MRKFVLFILLVCSLSCISGCGNDSLKTTAKEPTKQELVKPKAKQKLIVYRAAADGTEKLLQETMEVDDNGKPAVENALLALISTKPQDAKYMDVVPIGTKLLGLKIEKGVAYADFSKELMKKNQGAYDEMMLTYAIVNTLTEYPDIKKVQILVEGKKCVFKHMDLEEALTRNNTLLENGNKQ